ncbi:glycosyltransferase family 39 protein [Ilumatobacter sp.]|uniref:glycosyltransferase family 39 protein n=1 Tax=Ilumatobacter sp. TaxID=1967498 RepID=UPI003AF55ED4
MTQLDVAQRTERIRSSTWWRLLLHTLPVYVLSRACVLAGAAVVAAELRVDANLANENSLPLADPHGATNTGNAVRPMLDVLTSWDGLWYMDVVRNGYPTTVPPDVTYFVDEARAAFFPLFPLLGRTFDRILPGGDSLAVLVMNTLLGLVAIVLIAVIADRVYGERVARRTATLAALFPGSFVLSFAYSEALMLVLAAACLLLLLDAEWTAAGVFAALATATRPNGVALIAACAVAAFLAIRERRDWGSLMAVLLAPIGFITFQIWLGQHTGETGVWFRVQREAWDEGASFGVTALRNTAEAVWQPMTSPTDTITALSFVTTIVLLVIAWRAKMPWILQAYSWSIVVLMLVPATVTARPRFLYTAFPLLIGAAKWFDDRRARDETFWPMTTAACGAGLAALTGLYGVFGAIP